MALIKGGRASPVKGRNPLARQIESSFEKNFFSISGICLSASEHASPSIISCGQYANYPSSLLEDWIAVTYNLLHFDISN